MTNLDQLFYNRTYMDKKLLGLVVIFFLSFITFAFLTVFNKPITQFTRAKEDVSASQEKSLIIAWPYLSVPADGNTESTVNVFVISQSDKPVPNKTVTLLTTLGQVKEAQLTTDNDGKATFHLSSSTPGIAEIRAVVDKTVELSRKITVKFE